MADISFFASQDNVHKVPLNLSVDEAVVHEGLTANVLTEIIAEHERIRIAEYWEQTLLRPSHNGDWLEGLNHRKTSDGHMAPKYFTASFLQRITGKKKRGKALSDPLRAMPMKQQRELLLSQVPERRKDLRGVLSKIPPAFAPDFFEIAAACGSPQAFVNWLLEKIQTNTAPEYHTARYVELLVLLWSKDHLLFPLSVRTWHTQRKWATLRNPSYSARADFICDALTAIKLTNDSDLNGIAYTFFAISGVTSSAHWSLNIIDAYESFMLAHCMDDNFSHQNVLLMKSKVTRVAHTLRLLYNAANPDKAITHNRIRLVRKASKPLRTDGKFLWLVDKRPELSYWTEILCTFIGQLTTARTLSQVARLNTFADYLASLERPLASPMEVVRAKHIYDATLANTNTFFDYLRKNVSNKARASSILSLLRVFFDWYADYLIASKSPLAGTFSNPVLSTDKFGSDRANKGQTSRSALPRYVLEELKALLTEDDFAFGKSMKMQWVRVVDGTNGEPVKVWFPGLTVCLYLMLETPIRSHQARWADSGQLDEWIVDTTTHRYVINPMQNAIPGRREALLRLQHDSLRKADWFGLWINTNKTAVFDSVDVGYLIPYASQRLTSLLTMMQAWQLRYQLLTPTEN